jgi:chromosomal replication initiator protein
VLTSDRPPSDLDALEDRLRERFASGLVTDVRPPDLATRLTILRKRARHDAVPLAEPDALDPVAERIDSNIRALEGALIRVVAFHSLTGRPITRELSLEVLDRLYPNARTARTTIEGIQSATCVHFGIAREELLSRSRSAHVAWPRQVAMYLARELTDESLPAIGRRFGDRNHTTVMHACRRTAERMSTDHDAFDAVNSLAGDLRDATPDDRSD